MEETKEPKVKEQGVRLDFVDKENHPFTLVINKEQLFIIDKMVRDPLRLIPKDPKFILKVLNSRNRYSKKILDNYSLNPEEEKEYDKVKEDIVSFTNLVVKDCRKVGGRLKRTSRVGGVGI